MSSSIPTIGLLVPSDSDIKTIEGLKGKKIVIPIDLFYTLGTQQNEREFPEVFANVYQVLPAVFFAANKTWADENRELLGKFI